MSIKDMFLIADQLRDRSNGLNNIKDYLKVENAINQNWQDALTFDKNVAAINAANAKKAWDNVQGLQKSQGEHAALVEQVKHLYDPNTQSYRSEEIAHSMAAPTLAQSNNPYAMSANYQAHRAAALQKANAIAAIDPAQALALNNQAWGNAGISAKQNADGTLSVTNSQGYTRTLADPNLAAMYGADPLKTSSTLYGHQREDQVSDRNHLQAIDLQTNQADLNRFNNEHSLRLQNELNQAANRENAALKWDYAVKEHEWKKANGLYDSKDKGGPDEKTLFDVYQYGAKAGAEAGLSPEQQHNLGLLFMQDYHNQRMGKTAQSDPNPNNKAADIFAQTKPKTQNTQSSAAQAANKAAPTTGEMRHNLSSFAPNAWFGFYHQQAGFPHNTRAKAIEQAQANIKHLEDLIAKNQAINPKANIVANQKAALARQQAELAELNQIPERWYYQNHNPFSALWNWTTTGDSLPDPNTYHK